MSAMEPSTASQPAVPDRSEIGQQRTDATNSFKTAGAPSDRHFESEIVPGLVGPDFPFPPSVAKLFRKLFRRTDTPAARS